MRIMRKNVSKSERTHHLLHHSHHIFEYTFIFEIQHLTGNVLQCLCREIHTLIDQQQQKSGVYITGGADQW